MRLFIKSLFGAGSHDVDLDFDLSKRVSVLFGRNGSGKTITLSLLAAVQDGRFEELLNYPLEFLRVELEDGRSVTFWPQPPATPSDVEQGASSERIVREVRYVVSLPDGGASDRVLDGCFKYKRDESSSVFELLSDPGVRHGSILPQAIRGPSRMRWALESKDLRSRWPQLLAGFIEDLPALNFIRTDRLYIRDVQADAQYVFWPDAPTNRLMVEHLSDQIRDLVAKADREYRQASTTLDATLPRRLFAKPEGLPDTAGLRERAKNLAVQEQRLVSLGLLSTLPEPLDASTLDEAQRGTFAIILSDREAKLKPFEEVAGKAEQLVRSINKKLSPKRFKLDVEQGYTVESAAGEPLSLSCLSSGEQHELVLMHELLFDAEPGSLVLIDEPELSLHVDWQQALVGDLTEIARLADLRFVLATHSPYIAGEGDPQMMRLGPVA